MTASIYLAGILDSIMVGQIEGTVALSAINLTLSVSFLKNILMALFTFGGNTIAVVYKGKRENSKADLAFTLSFYAGMLSSLVLMAFGLIFAKQTAALLAQGNAQLEQYVLEYLLPLWLLTPFMVIVNHVAAFARTDGLNKLSTALPVVANVINLACDYIFMKTFGWGIAGAGWATIAGYAVRTVEIDAAEALHNIGMIRDLVIRDDRLAETLNLDVLGIIFADRDGRIDDIRDHHHDLLDFLGKLGFRLLELGKTRGILCNLLLNGIGFVEFLLAHQHTDLLAQLVAACAQVVGFLLSGSCLRVQFDDFIDQRQLGVLEFVSYILLNDFRILPDESDIQHLQSLLCKNDMPISYSQFAVLSCENGKLPRVPAQGCTDQ